MLTAIFLSKSNLTFELDKMHPVIFKEKNKMKGMVNIMERYYYYEREYEELNIDIMNGIYCSSIASR